MMSKDKRVFIGNVAFTFLMKRAEPITFTVQSRMEIVRQTTGTDEHPLEKWQLTGSRTFIATSGFDIQHFGGDAPIVTPVEMDMRAGTESWYRALETLLFSEKFLNVVRKHFVKKLKAQKGTYERGQIWEERI